MMKKINFTVAVFIIMVFKNGFAQQTPLFSEYNNNSFIINSAYAGLTPNAEIVLSSHSLKTHFLSF